jgi:hypothetical protein
MNNNFIPINKNVIYNKRFEYGKLESLRGWKRFATRKTRKRLGIELQALEEGQAEDVLTPEVTGATTNTSSYIDRNNYATYSGQVNNINQMYNNETEYGAEFLRALIDTRVSFVAGAGISVLKTRDDEISETVTKWVKSYFKQNKYFGSRFLEDVLISEMEGKCLLVNMPLLKEKQIRLRSYMWYKTHYNVEMKDKDNQSIKKVTYQKNQTQETEIAKPDDIVYIKTGGTPDRINNTIPKIANVLTDIENISRAKYDLRKNNHLFGRTTPYFKTKDSAEARSLLNKIQSLVWRVGRSFAGTAEFTLVEPSGRALEALKEEITQGMKIISLATSIPVHYLAYPELLSNRACYSSDTQTLTENGWKYYWEIDKNEKIACFNSENNNIEYVVPDKLFVYDYDSEMIYFKNRKMDILVTPDHKMWSYFSEQPPKKKEWQKITAEKLINKNKIYFKDYCNYDNDIKLNVFIVDEHNSIRKQDKQPTNFDANVFLEFLGYYLSEGGCGKYKTTPSNKNQYHYIVHLAQNEGENADKIRNCLNDMELKYNESKDKNGCIRWHIHHYGLYNSLSETFGRTQNIRRIPFKFRNICKKQLQILFDALMLGDGSWDKRKGRTSGYYSSISKELTDNVNDIMLKLGYTTNQQINTKVTKNGFENIMFRVNCCKSNKKEIRNKKIKYVDYQGKVYCFSTKTGLFFTKRNGKITIQGNTAETLVEVINAGTIQERTKWEEGTKNASDKAMVMAFERGWCPYNDPDAYEIRIDLNTYAALKQMIEIWYPLLMDDVIDLGTFRSMLPGIDPQRVKQLVEEQKKENMERFNEGLDKETEDEEEVDENEEIEKEI